MKLRDKRGMLSVLFLMALFAAIFFGVVALSAQEAAHPQYNYGHTSTTMNFHFAGDSYRMGYTDRLVMGGSGTFSGQFQQGQTVSTGQVVGEGSFAHFNGSAPAGTGTSSPIVNFFTGTWKATKFVSFKLVGQFGPDQANDYPTAAGILTLQIELVRPGTPDTVPSLLTLVSNLGPGGFSSGQPDGITLLAPNQPGGYFFQPIQFGSTVPAAGEQFVSVLFSTLDERRGAAPPPTLTTP